MRGPRAVRQRAAGFSRWREAAPHQQRRTVPVGHRGPSSAVSPGAPAKRAGSGSHGGRGAGHFAARRRRMRRGARSASRPHRILDLPSSHGVYRERHLPGAAPARLCGRPGRCQNRGQFRRSALRRLGHAGQRVRRARPLQAHPGRTGGDADRRAVGCVAPHPARHRGRDRVGPCRRYDDRGSGARDRGGRRGNRRGKGSCGPRIDRGSGVRPRLAADELKRQARRVETYGGGAARIARAGRMEEGSAGDRNSGCGGRSHPRAAASGAVRHDHRRVDRCNGCGACMVACSVENNVPPAHEGATDRKGSPGSACTRWTTARNIPIAGRPSCR
jgi:ferredoxin